MSKKQDRMLNKKRKAASLANIVRSNEADKQSKKAIENDDNSNCEKKIDPNDEPEMKKLRQIEAPAEVISDETYKSIRKELAAKKNALRSAPNFRLKSFGDKALLSTNPKQRQPLMLDDIQYLLMNALLGGNSPFKPGRWAVFEKANKVSHTVILCIEGLSAYNFSANESRFVKTKKIFSEQMEIVLPKCTKNRIIEELCFIPLTQAHKEKLINKYGSLEAAVHLNKEHHLITKSVFPIDEETSDHDSDELPPDESFPRTRLLLSPLQMMIEGYPMPLNGEFAERYREFRYTRESYKPVTKKSPMFGLDCEMCKTIKAENELARVSIVDENYESVYETLVRPTNRIVDYLTQWSGITKEMMQDVTKTLREVQEEVKRILPPDAILVGQSLNCDLSAMKLMHPYVIDTSIIFNLTGDRNRKSKLQMLAKMFLGEDIQTDATLGHSSIEDSTASLKLTKLKLSKDIYYGDCALQTKRKIEERTSYTGIVEMPTVPVRPDTEVATTLLSHALKRQKKAAIITSSSTDFDLKKFYSRNQFDALQNEGGDSPQHGIQHHKESSAKKVINKTREVIVDNDFNLSHFNILEDFLHEGDENADATADEKIIKSIDQVDKWIEKVWESVAHNGLFVVIFGGHEKNPNGVSMVRIKN